MYSSEIIINSYLSYMFFCAIFFMVYFGVGVFLGEDGVFPPGVEIPAVAGQAVGDGSGAPLANAVDFV